jgi:hypothetical protein
LHIESHLSFEIIWSLNFEPTHTLEIFQKEFITARAIAIYSIATFVYDK